MPAGGPRSLASIQVDVTTRLGAIAPATTTGMASLDRALGGGLRSGTHLLVSGDHGTGKTAFVLMLAYMAARARASVIFASVGLDETEVVSRLAARALHREYQNAQATYGTIWSGQSMQDAALRGPIASCLDTVAKKVGEYLHLHVAEPMEDVSVIAGHAAFLWSRNERVVVVVDGAEAFSAGAGPPGVSTAPPLLASSYDGRLSTVAYELSRLAGQGCAVITTCHSSTASLLAPATTVAAELRPVREPGPRSTSRRKPIVEHKPVDFVIVKNRLGPTPTLPLVYATGASVFEERPP
jgi:RecA/RadA recombinase